MIQMIQILSTSVVKKGHTMVDMEHVTDVVGLLLQFLAWAKMLIGWFLCNFHVHVFNIKQSM